MCVNTKVSSLLPINQELNGASVNVNVEILCKHVPRVIFCVDGVQVLKLIQIIAQARQTAKRISDQSAEVAANSSFLSWFSMSFSDPNNMFNGAEADDMGECVKKTHEFLDRALDYLCQIFRVSLQSY